MSPKTSGAADYSHTREPVNTVRHEAAAPVSAAVRDYQEAEKAQRDKTERLKIERLARTKSPS